MSQIRIERLRRVSRRSLVVIQQATAPLAATNLADASARRVPLDQPIFESLVIPLVMVVIDEVPECAAKMALAKRHQPIKAFVFDRPHEPFGIGVRIGRLKRGLHDLHARIPE